MRSGFRRCAVKPLITVFCLLQISWAQITDKNNYTPLNYSTFVPPATGGIYVDPIFGSTIKRITNAADTSNLDRGGNLVFITNEYSSMTPFNLDNSKFILVHQSYFGLYSGDGGFLKALPMEIGASSEPRWSRNDPNVLYYHVGNQLKKYDASRDSRTTVHTFNEYSTITGKGESDLSFDGDHFVFVGDDRFVFVYEISTDSKKASLDTSGRSFDSMYITPNNNVTITWLQAGTSRYNGIELFDSNMTFLRQVAHAGGHMDVTRDNGEEVLVWTNANDSAPLQNCNNGIVKIRLRDASQTCLLSLDWNLAVHISGTDDTGYVIIETYAPSNPEPGSSGWSPYTNEILQIKLDGTEVRRLAHHRSRPFGSYVYMPRASVSRDGKRLVFSSNHNLQALRGYALDYTDVYEMDLAGSSSPSQFTPTPTPPQAPPPVPQVAPPTPQTAPPSSINTTRVEQDAAAISYSGSWFLNNSSGHSASSSSLSVDAGSRTTFTFTGTSVRWIGYRDEWSGIANVYVDGELKATVDTYAAPAQYQSVLYSMSGLSANTHTLTVEVAGIKSSASAGMWVWIDAFESDNTTSTGISRTSDISPAGGRFEHDSGNASYTGTWFDRNQSGASGGTAKLAMDGGALVTFSFTGTGVSWIGYRDAWSGIARVWVDGATLGTVDTYSPIDSPQTVIHSIMGLSAGAHTLTIEALDLKNSSSGGSWIWIDAFEVKP